MLPISDYGPQGEDHSPTVLFFLRLLPSLLSLWCPLIQNLRPDELV